MKSSKILKCKKGIISLSLALTMASQMGCGSYSKPLETESIVALEEETLSAPIEDIKETIKEEINEEIKEVDTLKIAEEYEKAFSDYDMDYALEDYFISHEEVEDIIKHANVETVCTFDGEVKASNILDIISKNTLEFIKENPEYESLFINYDEIGEKFDEQVEFENQLFSVLLDIFIKSTNDISEDACKMQDLKIAFVDAPEEIEGMENVHKLIYHDEDEDVDLILGVYDEEKNFILLNKEDMLKTAEIDSCSYEDVLYLTLYHELNHMRQDKCNCRMEQDSKYSSINYSQDTISTLMESSAESELYNLRKDYSYLEKDHYSYTYFKEREDESLLLLMALFSEKGTPENYYNAIFDSDPASLYEVFDLNTDEEIYDFYKLLFIIDTFNYRTYLPFDYYETDIVEWEQADEFEHILGKMYRTEVFSNTLAKLVLYTKNNPDFTFQDNLMMFNIIKNSVCDDAYYLVEVEDEYKQAYDEEFVNAIEDLDKKYKTFLCEFYDVTMDEIKEIEDYDIMLYGDALCSYVQTGDAIFERFESDCYNLVNRFPLLRPIMYTKLYYFDRYNAMFDEDNLILTK